MAQQSTLQNIYSKSFPSQNLIDISIVEDTSPDRPFYKPRYFNFISISPGVKDQQGNRTFDRQQRIIIKCDYDKLFGLAHAIRNVIRGGQSNFSIIADSRKSSYNNGSGGIKSCFPSIYSKQGQNNEQIKMFSLSFKGEGNPFGNSMSLPDGLGLAEIIQKIADKTMELDMDANTMAVGRVDQNSNQRPSQQQQSQQQSQQPQQSQQSQSQQNNNSSTDSVINDFEDAMGQTNGQVPTDDDIPF